MRGRRPDAERVEDAMTTATRPTCCYIIYMLMVSGQRRQRAEFGAGALKDLHHLLGG